MRGLHENTKGKRQWAHNLPPLALALCREPLLDFGKMHDGGFRMLRCHVGVTGLAVRSLGDDGRVPYMTEAWYCCAEPGPEQVSQL